MLQWIKQRQKRLQKTATVLGVLFVAVFSFLNLTPAFAQSVADSNSTLNEGVAVIEQPLGLASTDIRQIIGTIIRVALGLIGIVMLGLVLYGGYLYMTAGGNEEQVTQAKRILRNGAIGLAIILSAYAIVTFVLRALGVGGGGLGGLGGGGVGTEVQNFNGSGALGGIVKDHYPARDESEVARNAKIIITFRKAVKVDSFVKNTNQSRDQVGKEIFGDCINIGANMNWKTDCDALVLDAEHINITRADTGAAITGAAVLATYQNDKAYTFVIRPYDYFGSNTDKIAYKVRLGPGVLLDDEAGGNPSAFQVSSLGKNYYEWQFTCSTELDTAPPVVKSVFPADGTTEDKNTVIQIDFNKAMDPTGVQGMFTDSGANYTLNGNTVFLKSAKSSVPVGTFALTNGYRTLEFTSTKECGKNACGMPIYCLPVCDKGADGTCKQDAYSLLVKAGRTFSASSFESIPFSGAMDVSGNALDANKNNKVDTAPNTGDIFSEQNKPDNFSWSFTINDAIDTTSPYLNQVTPGLDAEYVGPKDDVTMLFSKRMRVEPMYDIDLQQSLTNAEPLCRTPRVTFNADNTTLTTLTHCPFPTKNGANFFPVLTSAIEDVNYNCFFPGKGPGGANEASKRLKESSLCTADGKNCCPVTASNQGSPFCCNGAALPTITTQKQCLDYLKANP